MTISIITACFNSEATIEDTVCSVAAQSKPPAEYIIIDGGSSDRTVSIIEKHKDKISRLLSEKDKGIYDALNKGIALASSDVIGILHSDDIYAGPEVLKEVGRVFLETECDALYGDLQYVDRYDTNRIIRNWKSGYYRENIFLTGWMPPHPTFFVRREAYAKFGVFNTDFKSAADYELMLRFLHKNKIKVAYLPQVLIKMRIGGTSNKTFLNRIRANMEDRKAWKVNGLKPGLFTLWKKPLSKIGQYF